MKTYNNIDEFIKEAFPYEFDKIIKKKKSKIEEAVEELDSKFDDKLKAIIEGKPDIKNKPDIEGKAD